MLKYIAMLVTQCAGTTVVALLIGWLFAVENLWVVVVVAIITTLVLELTKLIAQRIKKSRNHDDESR